MPHNYGCGLFSMSCVQLKPAIKNLRHEEKEARLSAEHSKYACHGASSPMSERRRGCAMPLHLRFLAAGTNCSHAMQSNRPNPSPQGDKPITGAPRH